MAQLNKFLLSFTSSGSPYHLPSGYPGPLGRRERQTVPVTSWGGSSNTAQDSCWQLGGINFEPSTEVHFNQYLKSFLQYDFILISTSVMSKQHKVILQHNLVCKVILDGFTSSALVFRHTDMPSSNITRMCQRQRLCTCCSFCLEFFLTELQSSCSLVPGVCSDVPLAIRTFLPRHTANTADPLTLLTFLHGTHHHLTYNILFIQYLFPTQQNMRSMRHNTVPAWHVVVPQ